jgi:hypothetical protein
MMGAEEVEEANEAKKDWEGGEARLARETWVQGIL